MRNYKKDTKAVSTIIATILMVAVTVVLTGVLYVMVMGLGGGSSAIAPLGSWQDVSIAGNASATMNFGRFSSEVRPIDLRIYVSDGENNHEFHFPGILVSRYTNLTVVGTTTFDVQYEDLNFGANTVSAGDKLHFSNLEPDTVYTITVLHLPTQSVISMSGATSSFQTQP